jgi:hypothetical protein
MQAHSRSESRKCRAIEALKSTLLRVSGVKVKEIDCIGVFQEGEIEILAQVEIYGRSHTLACMMVPNERPELVRKSVLGFCHRATDAASDTTPVLIAPRISSGLQRLCREIKAGMIDLQGNARLEIGEIFIACQQVSQAAAQRKTPAPHIAHAPAQTGAAA